MSYVTIVGGTKLEGELILQGSKNAVLPILAAGVLCRGKVILHNCPDISDVRELLHALSFAGVCAALCDGTLELDASAAAPCYFGPELSGKTRGGVLLLGAFTGRFGEANMAYPGGCVIGARPIDLHCKVLRALSVSLTEEENGVFVKGIPQGGRIVLPYPSVGATENAVLAAVCAKGRTEIFGAAREPEVSELCRFLIQAGAKIQGIGGMHLVIDGVAQLHGAEYTVTGDRIAAGTYLAATAMTGGELVLRRTCGVCMKGIFESFRAAGMRIQREPDLICLKQAGALHCIPKLVTAPYPAFPTDMQSLMAALLCVAEGDSIIKETVFESRFGVVEELQKMGAEIESRKDCIFVHGVKRLRGANVHAPDLRSGAALVLAGLVAEGESNVYGYEYIARGYEDICGALCRLGANIIQREEY